MVAAVGSEKDNNYAALQTNSPVFSHHTTETYTIEGLEPKVAVYIFLSFEIIEFKEYCI